MKGIETKVYEIISDLFLVSEHEINDNIGPGDLEKWDSLGQIRLIARLEKDFDVAFSVNDVMAITKISDIIQILNKKLSKKIEPEEGKRVEHPSEFGESSLVAPKKVFWGPNSIEALSKLEFAKLVVITGGGKYSTPIKERLKEFLNRTEDIKFLEKPDGEPKISGINYLASELKSFSPNVIMAIGGGSVIDISKLAWALYENPEKSIEDFSTPFSVPPLREKSKFVAIPTTFGTGSEASSAATYSVNEEGNKKIIVSHEFIPDTVVLDPKMGESAPRNLIFSTAFDALTHAIEGYVSLVRNPLVEPYATHAITSIINALNSILEQGVIKEENLKDLCYSAYYAGIVQNNCSVGLTHSIAHQLGGFGIGHGVANAMFLIPVMRYNAERTDKYEELANYCNFKSHKEMFEAIEQIYRNSEVSLSQSDISKLKINKDIIIEGALNDITIKTNPVPASFEDIEEILDKL